MTEADVERVARAMAVADGYDPDEIITPNGGLRWRYYVPVVPAAMAATREIDAEALRNATAYRSAQRDKRADWLLSRANEVKEMGRE